jgi:hypothetical protein
MNNLTNSETIESNPADPDIKIKHGMALAKLLKNNYFLSVLQN